MIKIIAECGCNWTTFMEAKRMILEARNIGCWATKFQIFNEDNIKETPKEIRNQLKRIIINKPKAQDLFEYGKRIGIEVFFTPMFLEAIDWLEDIGINYYKIRHKDNTNRDFYQKIKKTKKFTFISISGPNDLWKNFVSYKRGGFLYCIPKYPAKYKDYKLNFSDVRLFSGVSDHTPDIKMLNFWITFFPKDYYWYYWEKHVKLNNTIPLEDQWSVSFSELEEVIKNTT